MTLVLILLFLVGGIALSAALLIIRSGRHEIESRVNLVVVNQPIHLGEQLAQLPAVIMDEYAHRIFGFGLAHRWGMKSRILRLAIFAAIAFAIVFLMSYAVLHAALWIALALGLAAFWFIPHMILRLEQRKAEAQFVEVFADAVDMVVRMLRAGLPITAAIRATGTDGPPPVNEVFAHVGDQVEIGIPFEDALAISAEQVGIADFRFFAAAVALQRSTGGNLAATLETLSEIIRKRRAARLKARAVTAEVRATAYILAALPFVVIGVLLLLNPRYLAPLIDDPRGNLIVGVAAALLITAFVTMRQMMQRVVKI